MAIEESNTFNTELLRRFGDLKPLAERVVNTFIDAKEYGSILNIEFTKEELDSLEDRLGEIDKMSTYGNLLDQMESDQLLYEFYPLLKQARIMSQKYECVVTNPPYMTNSNYSKKLSNYIQRYYQEGKYDLCCVFIIRCLSFLSNIGFLGMITQNAWMFQGSYKALRKVIFNNEIINLVHLGANAFDDIQGEVVQTATFVLSKEISHDYSANYVRLIDAKGEIEKSVAFSSSVNRYKAAISSFLLLPDFQVAYWISSKVLNVLSEKNVLSHYGKALSGLSTSNNAKFLRIWTEVDINKIGFQYDNCHQTKDGAFKWIPHNKGGSFRRWYGNRDYVVNWENDGEEIKYAVTHNPTDPNTKTWSRRIFNTEYFFKEGISWSDVATGKISCRLIPKGIIFNATGPTLFLNDAGDKYYFIALLNSVVFQEFLNLVCPGLHYNTGPISRLPIRINRANSIESDAHLCIELCKYDWDSFEISWNFKRHPLVVNRRDWRDQRSLGINAQARHDSVSLISKRYEIWDKECTDRFNQLKANEEEMNSIFIDIYGLQDELNPEVDDKDITVRKADLERDIKSLISYAVGCMFGRYSLDIEGLAYAGGEWDDSKYKSFIPDKDNIIPICDDEYFNDDITGRFIEFIKAAYGEDTLEENLRFIADALGGKGTSREVIRNYFINDFYKDHCNTYQVTGSGKRPIYWQFDSGKKNGFKALVYIHRYTPDLIARMRTSYVHEQQSKYENQISMIQNRINSAASTSERVKAEKELKKLKEQADELRVYEEKIHHWADKMEPMDLDDGVKANYSKFQELLTKIK